MSWTTLGSFQVPQLGGLQDALEGASAVVDVIQDVATVITPILRVLAAFQNRADIGATAVVAALDLLEAALEDVISDSAGHMLVVPLGKPFARAVDRPDLVLQELEDLTVTGVLRAPATTLVGDGGNYGLYRKIVESLYDRGDLNRPQLDPDSVVAGAILVFGADTFLGTIEGLAALQALFGLNLSVPLDNFAIKVPQNLKVRPVAVPSREVMTGFSVVDARVFPFLGAPTDPPPYAAVVTWDDSPVLSRRLAYGRWRAKKVGWRVYCKPNEKIRTAEPVDPWQVAEGEVVSPDVPLIGQTFEGTMNGTMIKGLDPNVTYWISAGFVYELTDPDTGETATIEPGWDALSTQRRLNLSEQAPINQFLDGTPPDWIAIASPLAPFAPLRQFFAELQAMVALTRRSFADFENDVNTAIDGLEQKLTDVAALISRLDELLDELTGAMAGFDIGTWVATFTGRGGNSFFVDEMGRLLLDRATPNRPPFDRGDEAIASIVLLTESSTLGGVQTFLDLMDALFGTSAEPSGFVVSDVNRIPAPEPEVYESPERTQKSLHELGVIDEDDDC